MKPSSSVGNRGLMHLNGDVICAIDTETTGLKAGFHDIIEIAIVALDAAMQPMVGIPPFDLMIRPKRPQNADPEATKVNGIDLAKLEVYGHDAYDAASLFDDWFEKLELVPGKRIAPLGQNWPFDAGFIRDWLGDTDFERIFDRRFRDTMSTALFLNDRADALVEPVPFPQCSLGALAKKLEIPHERSHRALEDALVTAKVYKKMLVM